MSRSILVHCLLLLPLLWAREALAVVTISVDVAGGSQVTVEAGTSVEVELFLEIDDTLLTAHGVSIDVGDNEAVNPRTVINSGGIQAGVPIQRGTQVGSFAGLYAFSGRFPAGRRKIGEFALIASTSATLLPGFFLAGVDSIDRRPVAPVVIQTAQLNVIPEPGTASLLLFGLGCSCGWMRRR